MEDNNLLLFECGICMENKTLECINFLPCIHFLCSNCYDKLIKNECPYCRNKIEDREEDSYDEEENEYHDVEFEMLVLEEDRHRTRRRKKRFKKQEKKIMKLMNNNTEVFVTINRNRYRVLSNLTET
jgi:hypothetical protein